MREFVPSRWVSWVARTIYNEPYRAARIVSEVDAATDRLFTERRWSWGGKEHSIRVVANPEPYLASSDSTEHFFKEHQWGFGIDRNGGLVRYEVRHPVWQSFPVVETSVMLDWELVYGNEFSGLSGREPICSSLALGSEIEVFPKASG